VSNFSDVAEEHLGDVYAFFAYRVGSAADAEDLTQATFERAWRAWGRYDPLRASARTWLLAIARNLLVDHYRSDATRREQPLEADPAIEAASADADLGLEPALEAALVVLGDREREIIALRFGADLPASEIATLTGLTLANVQQILSRSLRRLRSELDGAASE
jgi:RNA polymerase sigma-70 factor (ECF subfamily)